MENINRTINKTNTSAPQNILKYQIRWANLPEVKGSSIQCGKHPVLILQGDIGNKYSPNCQVCTFTSKTDKRRLPTQKLILRDDINHLEKDSVVQVESTTNIPKFLIGDLIGTITDEMKKEVDKAFMIQFGMKEVDCFNINYVNEKLFTIKKLKELFEITQNSDLNRMFQTAVSELKLYCRNNNRDVNFFYNDNNDTMNIQTSRAV